MTDDRRVLVTGASGFVGAHTLAPLAARGFDVHAVARRPGRSDRYRRRRDLARRRSPGRRADRARVLDARATHAPAPCRVVSRAGQVHRLAGEPRLGRRPASTWRGRSRRPAGSASSPWEAASNTNTARSGCSPSRRHSPRARSTAPPSSRSRPRSPHSAGDRPVHWLGSPLLPVRAERGPPPPYRRHRHVAAGRSRGRNGRGPGEARLHVHRGRGRRPGRRAR